MKSKAFRWLKLCDKPTQSSPTLSTATTKKVFCWFLSSIHSFNPTSDFFLFILSSNKHVEERKETLPAASNGVFLLDSPSTQIGRFLLHCHACHNNPSTALWWWLTTSPECRWARVGLTLTKPKLYYNFPKIKSQKFEFRIVPGNFFLVRLH